MTQAKEPHNWLTREERAKRIRKETFKFFFTLVLTVIAIIFISFVVKYFLGGF